MLLTKRRMQWAGMAVIALALPVAAATAQATAVAQIKTATGADAGTASFMQAKDGKVHLHLDLKGLTPGEHGVHIHAKGVCEAPDFKTAGGHFAPDGKQHGYLNPLGHHNGDLPKNVTIAADGTGKFHFDLTDVSIGTGKPNDILATGTAIVVHAGPDDEKSDPAGNAGARVACGVITAVAP